MSAKHDFEMKMRELKSESWTMAGFILVGWFIAGALCVGAWQLWLQNPPVLYALLGTAALYFATRWAVVWYYGRRVKMKYAERIMLE
jgi:uncharacterized protein (DUF2062 family)